MDRKGDQIIHSRDEMRSLSLPEAVSVESAIMTAHGLEQTARTLRTQNEAGYNSTNTQSAIAYRLREARAQEFTTYCNGIYRLCAAEIVELAFLTDRN